MPVLVGILLQAAKSVWEIDFQQWSFDAVGDDLQRAVFAMSTAISAAFGMINVLGQVTQHVLQDQFGAWEHSKVGFEEGAAGFGQLGYNELQAWGRLLTVIIPGSLKWLDGHTHQWVDAKYDWQIRDFWHYWRDQWHWDDAVLKWADNWVDPNLERWIEWYNKWHQRVERVSGTWADWFDHPEWFGNWGAPPLIGPTIDYYADPEHQQSRDNLVEIMIDASPDRFRHVESAALAILQSPWP